ncbi:hypothetical protein ACFC00_40210 [Streptomyces adustus]|uniref:hypothetical protein n=1 Tax=Streptomyces adustus TaxID=1609272 RepID=UPI0035DCAD59
MEPEKPTGSVDAWIALDRSSYEPGWLRDTPLAERLTCRDCPHAVFRRVLAADRDLPDEAWRRLDNDPDVLCPQLAAPTAPPHVLVRLLRAHGDVCHVRPLLVDHSNFASQTLRAFVDKADLRVRVLVLQDPELPVPGLRRFADCEEGFLDAGVAGHPDIVTELLERLLADREPKVADTPAATPVLPRAQMQP